MSEGIEALDSERASLTAELLAAVRAGSFTLGGFSQAVKVVRGATSMAELRTARWLMPPDPGPPSADQKESDRRQLHLSVIAGLDRRSPLWRMARRTLDITLFGTSTLELDAATVAATDMSLTRVSLFGGLTLQVPPGQRVEVGGFSLRGRHGVHAEKPLVPGAPTVRVRAYSLLGGVTVRRPPPVEL